MSALDKFLKDKRAKLSELRKKRRKLPDSEKYKYDDVIEELEDLTRRFGKSVMEPRQVEHLTINYKLYIRFLKKLKGLKTKVTVKEHYLLLEYENSKGWVGHLELYDLSEYFEGYGDIPKAEIEL